MTEEQHSANVFDHIIPEIEEWPIYKLSNDRRKFVAEIDQFTFNRLVDKHGKKLPDLLSRTAYMERIRIKEDPWKVDPPNENLFWRKIQRQIVKASVNADSPASQAKFQDLLFKIIHRYSEEIVGTFKINTFLFARRFLTFFFNRMLNTAASGNIFRIWGSRHRLEDKLLIRGEIRKVRSLMKKGTVVILPTHFSNLDSIMIGYAIDSFAGLPSFSYGAGLNLYNTGYTAYFMNRLGAYRVDRRKKNPIYLETLKAMSNLSLQRGVNSIFFPGGTRSRSGALESRLKLGLLSSVVEAQRSIFQNEKDQKVFVVPLIISYHFVLEARQLIEQYLRQTGKEKYMKSQAKPFSIRKTLRFLWQFFSASSDITLAFGHPMDVLGNLVNEDGKSFDIHGREINVREYFIDENGIMENLQRESEYTRILSEKVVERFYAENIVLSSHLVAFAAFRILERENPGLDLYGVLRLPPADYVFPLEVMKDVIAQLKAELIKMKEAGKVNLSKEVYLSEEEIIKDGIRKIGIFHTDKPLRFNKKKQIVSDSFPTLFYYHNRLENYGLEKKIQWKSTELELAIEMEEDMES